MFINQSTMRGIVSIALFNSIFISDVVASVSSNDTSNSITKKVSQAHIPFVANQGQFDSLVAFQANTLTAQIYVSRDGELVYRLPVVDNGKQKGSWAFKESWLKPKSLTVTPKGINASQAKLSYYKGNDKTHWYKQLHGYDAVSLGQVYTGVDVHLVAHGNNIEKLFYLRPGASVENIRVVLEGVEAATVNADGRLELSTEFGKIHFTAPLAYQMIDGKRKNVTVAYATSANPVAAKNPSYGFKVGQYDSKVELVIDPLLASTFVGGVNANPPQYSNYDQDIAYSVIESGNEVYIGGVTQSTDFPVLLGYSDVINSSGQPDGFIARFSGDLTTLLSSTIIGTEYFDRVSAIEFDTDGSVVAVGQAGYGFPITPGAYNYSGVEPAGGGFAAKFSADLSTLLASAIVTPSDYPVELAVGNGSIYFAGRTNNPNFPITSNAYLGTCCPVIGSYGLRDFDGYAGKITSDLSSLQSMTYLGGNGVTGIAVAADSSVYFSDSFDSGITGYLSRMDSDLTTRFASISLYPGTTSGSSRHYFNDVTVYGNSVITAGQTYLNDLPVSANAYDNSCGTDGNCNNSSSSLYIPKPDGFVAKYSLDLQTVQAMTYFGGSNAESVRSVDVDSLGNIIVAGETLSTDLPSSNPTHDADCGVNGQCDAPDVFVAKFSNDLSQLLYASYLGGGSNDHAHDIAVRNDDMVYVVGYSASTDFPTTTNAFDTSYAGGAGGVNASYDSDAFISLFDMSGSGGSGGTGGTGGTGGSGGGTPVPDPTPVPGNIAPVAVAGADQTVASRDQVYLDGSASYDSDGQVVSYLWTQIEGKEVSLQNKEAAIANFRAPRLRNGGTYTLILELQVTDDKGAVATDQVTVWVQ